MTLEDSENLFSYGTLQTETVQLGTFGRKLEGKFDALVGYRLMVIQIQDKEFVAQRGGSQQRNLQFTGQPSDIVEGTVFTVTRKELEQADLYEPAEYKRVRVELRSGRNAWVYLTVGQ